MSANEGSEKFIDVRDMGTGRLIVRTTKRPNGVIINSNIANDDETLFDLR
jgi:hypothetical protein